MIKKSCLFFYTISSDLPLGYSDIYLFTNGKYEYNKSVIYGSCFTKIIYENQSENQDKFISDSGKKVNVSATTIDNAQVMTKDGERIPGKIIKSGSKVMILDMYIKGDNILILIKEESSNISGWVNSDALDEISCTP